MVSRETPGDTSASFQIRTAGDIADTGHQYGDDETTPLANPRDTAPGGTPSAAPDPYGDNGPVS